MSIAQTILAERNIQFGQMSHGYQHKKCVHDGVQSTESAWFVTELRWKKDSPGVRKKCSRQDS